MSAEPVIFHSRDDGYNIIYMEPGSDATWDTRFYQASSGSSINSGSVTSDSSNSMTGPRSIKIETGSAFGTNFASAKAALIFSNMYAFGRVSFYVNFRDYPAVDPSEASTGRISGNFFQLGESSYFCIGINHLGQLRFGYYSGISPVFYNQVGPYGATLSLNTWYRICLTYDLVGFNVNSIRVYVDGVQTIAIDNDPRVYFNGLMISLSFSYSASNYGRDRAINIDDVYADDNHTLEDTGDIRVTNKRAASNYINNFPTAIGNNPSNRYENVNEQPINTANGWQENSGSPVDVDETYGIEASFSGDVDLSGYGGIYPSNLPTVGLRTNLTNGVNLYDCGMLIAFSTDLGKILDTRSWYYMSTVAGTGNVNLIKPWCNGDLLRFNNVFTTGTNPSSPSNADMGTTPRIFYRTFDQFQVDKSFIFHSAPNAAPFIFYDRP